jgi:hypothetical protein
MLAQETEGRREKKRMENRKRKEVPDFMCHCQMGRGAPTMERA